VKVGQRVKLFKITPKVFLNSEKFRHSKSSMFQTRKKYDGGSYLDFQSFFIVFPEFVANFEKRFHAAKIVFSNILFRFYKDF